MASLAENQALIVAVGSAVLAVLVYFAGRQGDTEMEKRTVDRENTRQDEQAREAAISTVVAEYNNLVRQTGAGASLNTVKDAGIAQLKSDREVRKAIDRMAASGQDPMGAFRNHDALWELDLLEVFKCSVERKIPVDSAIEEVFRKKHERR